MKTSKRSILAIVGVGLALSLGAAEETRTPLVRIAELEIEPSRLDAFKKAVKEEMETLVRDESGVLAIYAVAEKDNPCMFRFFEMYVGEAAFHSHRESAHFRKCVETTKNMIKSRTLIETVPIQLSEKKR